MICEKCHQNKAIVLFKQGVGNQEITYQLCNECAKNMEFFQTSQIISTNEFSELFNQVLNGVFGVSEITSVVEEKTCFTCGISFHEIKAAGRVGCADCYHSFKKELWPTISQMQKTTIHTGKFPKVHKQDFQVEKSEIRINEEVEILTKKLNEAVESEKYELAIEFRDKINSLKNGGDSK